MNAREKRLAIACGAVAAILAVAFGVHAYFIKPLRAADGAIAELRGRRSKLESQTMRVRVAYSELRKAEARTFGGDVSVVSALVGRRLTELIAEAGLDEHDFARFPMGERRLRGASEVGWSVQGVGPMARIVDFLFLLEADPYLTRVESLTVAPRGAGQETSVSFRYLTLVFTPSLGVERKPLERALTLESNERRELDRIVARDIFRPYVKKPPLPRAPSPAPASTPAGPGPELFKVVSLSQWRGESEVLVKNTSSGEVSTYRVGDALAGGVVAAVEYTARPSRRNPGLQSMSRVIIAFDTGERVEGNGDETESDTRYWAIESGGTLAEKYELEAGELPASMGHRIGKK